MDIFRAEKIAQDKMVDDPNWDKTFILLGSTGLLVCEWLDPYMGIFKVKGHEGFINSADVPAETVVLMNEKNK